MQKSPIACRPLADLLGQSVRFQGYLSYWKTANKTEDTAFLLRHVKVVPYKGCKEQIRTLDHVWLYLEQSIHAETKLERFGGYSAVGRVVSYIRSNGTRDFALDIESYVPIDSYIDRLKLCGEPRIDHIKAKTPLLKKLLNALKLEGVDFGIDSSYEEVYRNFREEYEFCLRQVEINERYESNKQYRSRPNPNILKFASPSSRSAKVTCRGFAAS